MVEQQSDGLRYTLDGRLILRGSGDLPLFEPIPWWRQVGLDQPPPRDDPPESAWRALVDERVETIALGEHEGRRVARLLGATGEGASDEAAVADLLPRLVERLSMIARVRGVYAPGAAVTVDATEWGEINARLLERATTPRS